MQAYALFEKKMFLHVKWKEEMIESNFFSSGPSSPYERTLSTKQYTAFGLPEIEGRQEYGTYLSRSFVCVFLFPIMPEAAYFVCDIDLSLMLTLLSPHLIKIGTI